MSLSGSFRRDGSSVFGSNHRWGNFYSVGGTWNISQEDFMENISFISFLNCVVLMVRMVTQMVLAITLRCLLMHTELIIQACPEVPHQCREREFNMGKKCNCEYRVGFWFIQRSFERYS